MSFVKVYIHLVFTTKNREPFLNTPELRKKVFQHIKKNADEKGISIDCVNGFADHAHCLISLGCDQSMSKVAQLIKGESSFWINQNKLTPAKFTWQDDYWAMSVSEKYIKSVRNYIHNQETHHSKQTFAEELNGFQVPLSAG